jgi:hypothetical protein
MQKGSRPWPRTGGTTPFPNILIDRVMPYLTDTEWRVLVVRRSANVRVECRQWQAKSGRFALSYPVQGKDR